MTQLGTFHCWFAPCAVPDPVRAAQQKSIRDRALDVKALLVNLPAHVGDRIDMDHVGMLGQSRGSVTALIAAGGSTLLNIPAEPLVDAVMTTAAASRPVTFFADMENVGVPTLLVTGKIDRNSLPAITVDAFNAIGSEEKVLVVLSRAEHGVYSGQRCGQMQATGAIFQSNPRAIGEQLLFETIILSPNSSTPIDYCSVDYFVNPTDIRPLVKSYTGIDVTPSNVPQDLDAAEAMRMVGAGEHLLRRHAGQARPAGCPLQAVHVAQVPVPEGGRGGRRRRNRVVPGRVGHLRRS